KTATCGRQGDAAAKSNPTRLRNEYSAPSKEPPRRPSKRPFSLWLALCTSSPPGWNGNVRSGPADARRRAPPPGRGFPRALARDRRKTQRIWSEMMRHERATMEVALPRGKDANVLPARPALFTRPGLVLPVAHLQNMDGRQIPPRHLEETLRHRL